MNVLHLRRGKDNLKHGDHVVACMLNGDFYHGKIEIRDGEVYFWAPELEGLQNADRSCEFIIRLGDYA